MRAAPLAALSALLLGTSVPPARADVRITVDKASQRMEVAVDGRPRYDWPVSTGVSRHDTPSGAYRPFRMERTHFSREWDDAPMPYALFFTNQGHAIHGTGHVRNLGRAASHGCVRLSVGNAATLFALVRAEGMGRTSVRIEGETEGEPGAAMAEREGRPAPRLARAGRRAPDPFGEDGLAPDRTAPATAYYGPAGRPLYAPVRGYGVPPGAIDGGW